MMVQTPVSHAAKAGSPPHLSEDAVLLFPRVRDLLLQVSRTDPSAADAPPGSSLILRAFDILCAESLALDIRRRAPEFSRINADGTPFQFALSLSRGRPTPLQFLSEAGRPGASMAERLRASLAALRSMAQLFEVEAEFHSIAPLLHDLAPEHDPELLANPSGVLWIAPSVLPAGAASLTIYLNSRWGCASSQWERLGEFATALHSVDQWRQFRSMAGDRLSPLGMALTLTAGHPPLGRVYLAGYGVALDLYRSLFLTFCPAACAAVAFDSFVCHVLGEDIHYPTRSAVFSLELHAGAIAGAKFELCAHCAFDNDPQAASRISAWLKDEGFQPEVYREMLCLLTRGRTLPPTALPALHAYCGIGLRAAEPYASIYLNPGPALETA